MPKLGRFFFPLTLCAFLPLLGGCSLFSAPNPVNNQLRREKLDLEEKVADLQQKLDANARVIQGMREASSMGTTQPAITSSELAQLFTTHGLKFGRLTGGVDLDRAQPGDEGLRVYVAPVDDTGDAIKAAGSFTIEAFDLDEPGSALLGTWTFDIDQSKENWRSVLLDYNYAFTFPWKRVPTHEQVTIKVRFLDALTRTPFTAQQVVKVKLPATTQPSFPPS